MLVVAPTKTLIVIGRYSDLPELLHMHVKYSSDDAGRYLFRTWKLPLRYKSGKAACLVVVECETLAGLEYNLALRCAIGSRVCQPCVVCLW
jgi:hypothetical protein